MVSPENKTAKQRGGIKFFFLVISFWVGTTVMGFELVGARLLMPLFGMGCDTGGLLNAKNYRDELSY